MPTGGPRPTLLAGCSEVLNTELAHEPADRVLRGCSHPALPGEQSFPEQSGSARRETVLMGPR